MSEESLSTDAREETAPVSASADTASGEHGAQIESDAEADRAVAADGVDEYGADASPASEQTGDGSDGAIDGHDTHDELSPQSRRRARLILTVVAVLGIAALVMLYFIPPLSWTPQKEVQSNFRPVASVVKVEPGAGAQYALSYAAFPTDLVILYEIEVEQKSHYPKGDTRVLIRAGVEVSVPDRRDTDDTVSLLFDHVEAHAYDGDEEVKLASAGAMLERIAMYARIEAQGGLGTIVPDANVNPQVARVLFVLGDAFRQAWPPLPTEKLGNGGSWHAEDVASKGPVRRSGIVLHVAEDGHYDLDVRTTLSLGERALGNGQSRISLADGTLQSATVDFSRDGAVIEGGVAQQTVHATIRRVGTKEKRSALDGF